MWPYELSKWCSTIHFGESFHKQFNAQFYATHPAIFSFIYVISKLQCTVYIKMRSSESIGLSQTEFLMKQAQKVNSPK